MPRDPPASALRDLCARLQAALPARGGPKDPSAVAYLFDSDASRRLRVATARAAASRASGGGGATATGGFHRLVVETTDRRQGPGDGSGSSSGAAAVASSPGPSSQGAATGAADDDAVDLSVAAARSVLARLAAAGEGDGGAAAAAASGASALARLAQVFGEAMATSAATSATATAVRGVDDATATAIEATAGTSRRCRQKRDLGGHMPVRLAGPEKYRAALATQQEWSATAALLDKVTLAASVPSLAEPIAGAASSSAAVAAVTKRLVARLASLIGPQTHRIHRHDALPAGVTLTLWSTRRTGLAGDTPRAAGLRKDFAAPAAELLSSAIVDAATRELPPLFRLAPPTDTGGSSGDPDAEIGVASPAAKAAGSGEANVGARLVLDERALGALASRVGEVVPTTPTANAPAPVLGVQLPSTLQYPLSRRATGLLFTADVLAASDAAAGSIHHHLTRRLLHAIRGATKRKAQTARTVSANAATAVGSDDGARPAKMSRVLKELGTPLYTRGGLPG